MIQNLDLAVLRNKEKEKGIQEDLAVSVRIKKTQQWINSFFIKKFFMCPEKRGALHECNKIWKELYTDWFPKIEKKDKFKWL